MIIGNGLLANKFKEFKNDDFLFLAFGVSNSLCTDTKEFEREFYLINDSLKKHSGKTFIYFSTTSLINKTTPYTEHKKNIENIIKNSNEKYYIFRIPQIVGVGGNSNNFFNFLKESITKNKEVFILNNKRSLIDVDDLFEIVKYVIINYKPHKIYNLYEIESLYILEIFNLFCEVLKNKTEYKISHIVENDLGKNCEEIDKVIKKLSIKKENYTKNLIKKYANF